MTTEEIMREWKVDCKINKSDYIGELAEVGALHGKYLGFYLETIPLKVEITKKLKARVQLRTRYWKGVFTKQELEEQGWEQAENIPVSKVDEYVARDEVVSKLQGQIDTYEEQLKALESIIKSVNSKQFLIQNMIKWEMFMGGQ